MTTEIWAILGTGLGVFIGICSLVYTMIRNFRADFDSKYEKMEQRWIETNKKMDLSWNEINKRMDGVYHILLTRIKET